MEIGTSSVSIRTQREGNQDSGKRQRYQEFHQREAATHLSNLLNT